MCEIMKLIQLYWLMQMNTTHQKKKETRDKINLMMMKIVDELLCNNIVQNIVTGVNIDLEVFHFLIYVKYNVLPFVDDVDVAIGWLVDWLIGRVLLFYSIRVGSTSECRGWLICWWWSGWWWILLLLLLLFVVLNTSKRLHLHY